MGSVICLLLLSVLLFFILKIFPIMVDVYGLYTVAWVFAGVCGLGSIFCIICVKETAGKSINL